MPRPRVKPHDRLRSARACDTCKSSKKRCDGALPCNLCSRKGLADTCAYTAPSRRRRWDPHPLPSQTVAVNGGGGHGEGNILARVGLSPRDGSSSSRSVASGEADENETRLQAKQDRFTERNGAAAGNGSHSSSALPPTTTQRPVMLSSSSGEKVFVGTSAAISFLRFLQTTLKHYVGPSGFTDGQHTRRLFEVAPSDADVDNFDDDLQDEERIALVQCFLHVSSGILDLFTPEDVDCILNVARQHRAGDCYDCKGGASRRAHQADIASLYLMIAIGSQCGGTTGTLLDQSRARRYSLVARKMAFEGMLEDPTINLVRTFLLMAFYMLGACHRNSAFMYLGVASKSADILGLHASGTVRQLSGPERDTRLRTAKSLRVFDIICSSILGRQSSSLPLRSVFTPTTASEQDSSFHSSLALHAAWGLSSILDDIVKTFADDGKLDTAAAKDFLQKLNGWSRTLPPLLRERLPRNGRITNLGPERRRIMTGNVHIASMYYFSVILVTRQFLVQHVMPQLYIRRQQSSPAADAPEVEDMSRGGTRETVEFSQTCIEAATYMVQMCRDAMDAKIFWGNMCIMKAWVFAAGLVLGFPLLVDSGASIETLKAFDGSREVLHELGRLSPQAAQYHHILTAFSDAIATYRKQVRHERRLLNGSFEVEPILSFDLTAVGAAECVGCVDVGGIVGGGDGNSGGVGGSVEMQLPTPNLTACDDMSGFVVGDGGSISGAGGMDLMDRYMANLPELLSPEILSERWPFPEDDGLMLRLLWDGYTTNVLDPMPQKG